MTPTTPADASPAAGETLQDRLRLCAQRCQKLYDTDEGSEATIQAAAWRLNEAANALDASRAETDAMRAERDEANARAEDRASASRISRGLGRYSLERAILAKDRAQALEAEVSDLKAKLARIIQAHDENSGAEPSVSVFEREIDRARTTLAAIGETK